MHEKSCVIPIVNSTQSISTEEWCITGALNLQHTTELPTGYKFDHISKSLLFFCFFSKINCFFSNFVTLSVEKMALEKKCLNSPKSSVHVYVRLRLILIMMNPDISEFENSIDPD